MNGMTFTGLSALILDTELQVVSEFFGEVEVPEIVLTGQQTVEHDITHRAVGIPGIVNIIIGKFGLQGSV